MSQPSLTTTYMGLTLKNPIIAASSGLTATVKDIIEIEKFGAGAVVLKSIFEEEIISEMEKTMAKMHSENYLFPETLEFYENDDTEDTLTNYLKLITECKATVSLPIIASINCITPYNWPYFARAMQDAGADALELNIAISPINTDNTSATNEKIYLDIIKNVLTEVNIPVSIKISPYFSNLGLFINELSDSGIQGIVMFNRFYSPDINTDTLELVPANIYSLPNESILPLQWIGLSYKRVNCHLSASTGVHDGNTMVKMLLAGAQTVQIASILYKKGLSEIPHILSDLSDWMTTKDFKSIDEFRGILSQSSAQNPASYQRLQFMKQYSNK